MKISTIVITALTPVATLLCLGCGSPAQDRSSAPPAIHEENHAEHEHPAASEYSDQLAKLSSEDRTAAEAQRICPVSDQPLGSMGVPPQVVVNGQKVFLCCQNCEGELHKDPEKYLQKLAN